MLARKRLPPHISDMLADEQPGPEQIAAFKAMTGEQRFRVAEQLYWSARKMKAAGIRAQHPEWTEERVQEEMRRVFLHPPDEIIVFRKQT